MTTPRKYRWLTEGNTYTYGPKLGKGDDSRRGTACQVVTLPLPGRIGNALVRWPDGHTAVVPSGVLRKLTPGAPAQAGAE